MHLVFRDRISNPMCDMLAEGTGYMNCSPPCLHLLWSVAYIIELIMVEC